MENVRNKRRVKFKTDSKKPRLLKWQSKIDFDSAKTYQGFHLYYVKNTEVMFDKPIFIHRIYCFRSIKIIYV